MATFVQSTKMQICFENHHGGIHWKALAENSDEYSCARVSIIFQVFASFCIGQLANKVNQEINFL